MIHEELSQRRISCVKCAKFVRKSFYEMKREINENGTGLVGGNRDDTIIRGVGQQKLSCMY